MLKVYYQCADFKVLPDDYCKGDVINERGLIRAISRFAKVYYSGNLVYVNKPNLGTVDYPESIHDKMLKDNYDIYMVRSNKPVMKNIPQGKKIVYYASPYIRDCYDKATVINVQSERWAEILRDGKMFQHGLSMEFVDKTNKAVSFGQVFHDEFSPKYDNQKTQLIKKSFESDFSIGCFGRILSWSFPTAIISLLPEINKEIKTVFILGKNNDKDFPGYGNDMRYIKERTFCHGDMPFVYSACDLIVESFRGLSWEYCGSIKTMEAAACGTPIILGRSPAREEMLGKDYPLFVPKELLARTSGIDEIKEKIIAVFKDAAFNMQVREMLIKRIAKYSEAESAIRIEKIFKEVL